MGRLTSFISISLDGYYADATNDMSWAHNAAPDAEWDAFVNTNASGDGQLLFGRKTFENMARFWPTPAAMQQLPVVATRMNKASKIVFSKTLDTVTWNNTRLVKGDLAAEVRALKKASSNDMTILCSNSIVTQLAQERLVDEYQTVVVPVLLGGGKAIFGGLKQRQPLKLVKSRIFANGNVVLWHSPA
jgi:dihydrofolate reductase